MKWISTKDKLPPEGKRVLARHTRGTWSDRDDPDNVNCVVVKLVKGLSKEDRQKMKDGEIPMEYVVHGWGGDTSRSKRTLIFKSEDEQSNNLKPYKWDQFGPDSFFGQDISHWIEIPILTN